MLIVIWLLAGCLAQNELGVYKERTLLYSADEYGVGDIYLLSIEDDSIINLTNSQSINDINPSWSPDGTRIVFTEESETNGVAKSEIYIYDIDSKKAVPITSGNGLKREPDWSPDGDKTAFWATYMGDQIVNGVTQEGRVGDPDIYIYDMNLHEFFQLTNHPGEDITPKWSPDGNQIAYVSNQNGNYDILLINSDGSNLTNLTQTKENEYSPTWSPDGKQIAYLIDNIDRSELAIISLDDFRNVKKITLPRKAGELFWQYGGNGIIFTMKSGEFNQIFSINLTNDQIVQMTTDYSDKSYPEFNPP